VSNSKPSPFIVVDSLIAFLDGTNENDAKEMRAFLGQDAHFYSAWRLPRVVFRPIPARRKAPRSTADRVI